MISIENLSKKYGETVVFKETFSTFPSKGLVCVLGSSGCGKTTLLNMIAGFDRDFDGEISVNDTRLSEMKPVESAAYRRDNIGFVFQNYHLLSGYTSLENILLATDAVGEGCRESSEKAMNLLEKLGLSGKAEQKIETLSGGEKQRVAIGRALINDPSIILADEPTGALDRKNSTEIMKLLKTLSEERLVIVITHDKNCAEYADEIVTISDGKLKGEKLSQMVDSGEKTVFKTKEISKISLWKRAQKNFKVHLYRNIAIALAVSVGVLCFALSLSSGNMMKQSITEFENKNTAYHNGYIKVSGNEAYLIDLLEKDERLENIYAQYVMNDVSLHIDEKTVVIDEDYPMAKAVEQMSYGTMPRRGENEVALSPSLAAKFDQNIQNLVRKKAEIIYNGQICEVEISGIFNAGYDDIYVSSDLEQEMTKNLSGEAYSISYDVTAFEDIVAVSDSLKAQNINSQNASSEVAAFQKTAKNLNRLFLTVSILIFAVGLFISIILLVKQQNTRFHEVGLLSALGYTKGSIGRILAYENVLLSGAAALSSLILTGLTFAFSKAFSSGFVLNITILQVIIALCLTVILMMVIGYGSCLRLINTEPAEALKK